MNSFVLPAWKLLNHLKTKVFIWRATSSHTPNEGDGLAPTNSLGESVSIIDPRLPHYPVSKPITVVTQDSLSLRPFSHVDANGCEENGLASQHLVNKMSGEYQAIKSILPLKRSFESMNASICINCSLEIVPALTNIISSSPYSKLLMQRQYTELTPDVCAIINKDWDFFPQIKFATVQIFAGAILYNTTNGQAIMLNTIEAYGRTKSIDPHREPFGKLKGFTKPTSLPPPGKIPYPDIWPVSLHTSEGTISTHKQLYKPSIGAVTLNFKLDKKDALATKIFLDHDNLQVALSMATDPAITRTSDTNIVYQLRQIRSKFDADNAYSLCRASGPFTKTHVRQPFTIFTLADYDRGTSPLSSLFRHMATIVLRLGVRATLAKATVESCLVQGNLDTQNAFTAIIALYGESNEIPILGNSELSKRLEIVANSLAPSLVATNDYVAKEIALAFQFYN
ncbi:hypothetical protein G6F43_012219 [Rhizopus delemar]|nr:hypothetical protein G6F43_012219 [Rhizopus delemar]